MRALLRFVLFATASLALSSCVRLTFAWADLKPNGDPASPPVLAAFGDQEPVDTPEQWKARRALLQRAFEEHVVGKMPDASETRVIDKRVLDSAAFGGSGRLEEWTLSATAVFNGVAVETREVMGLGGFPVQIVLPAGADSPVPIILMETFCPSWDAMPHESVSRPVDASSMSDGVFGSLATYVFGRYICTPPYKEILSRGFAVGIIYPGAVAPDRKEAGLAELARLSEGHVSEETRWGAVAAWAWLYSRVIDALESDERFDRDAMIAWGHSRYGKATLFAAAFDERIDGVIAHQSGTGGASLNRDKPGESVKSMTKTYPHWFAEAYANAAGREETLPVDQHHLLALIAPRPVLLGNARRDVWSDPNGAFRAAAGADPVWALWGSEGLQQARLDEWNPQADIAFWIRPGTHGVVEEDWPAFLEFLEAHFGNRAPG